jgi:hypothetical protein
MGGAAFGILGQLISEPGDMFIRIPGQFPPFLRVGHELLLTNLGASFTSCFPIEIFYNKGFHAGVKKFENPRAATFSLAPGSLLW